MSNNPNPPSSGFGGQGIFDTFGGFGNVEQVSSNAFSQDTGWIV